MKPRSNPAEVRERVKRLEQSVVEQMDTMDKAIGHSRESSIRTIDAFRDSIVELAQRHHSRLLALIKMNEVKLRSHFIGVTQNADQQPVDSLLRSMMKTVRRLQALDDSTLLRQTHEIQSTSDTVTTMASSIPSNPMLSLRGPAINELTQVIDDALAAVDVQSILT